ncbi:MAG: signal recognition particle-docking protein FtsY [Eubacteriales bacterium]|nr:signal recognition particle-docking protein FtsY [Eubacteriales bacterium]MDD3882167.1 signal recognition particle-docking protein FtsY [Eubacteriales bacterium]MDD4513789.1 signal recognition particle-docking protein FtsY [Eubacteriales bacterium]
MSEGEKKKGWLTRLRESMTKSRANMGDKMEELVESTEVINEDFYDDLTDILIMADVGVKTTDKVIAELRDEVDKQKIKDAKKARELLRSILIKQMNIPRPDLRWPMVMLFVGVNGVGKTTTIGKMALRFSSIGRSVLLAAGDTFRAAAGEQLDVWAKRANVPIIRHQEGADPAAVVFDAIQSAKAHNTDLLMVDTAGRLHNKKNLMEELNKIRRVIARNYPEAEVRSMLVLDATTGQNGLNQAKEFKSSAEIGGIVLTKLDGTAKGGVVLAIEQELQVPVWYVGVGEGIDDLQAFEAKEFIDAIF